MYFKRITRILVLTILLFTAGLTFAGEVVYVVNSYIHNSPIPDWATVAKLRGSDLALLDSAVVGGGAHSVAVSHGGRRIWVTCPRANNVTVLNGFTFETLRIIDFGDTEHRPFGIAVNPDGSRVYVTFKSLGTVGVFDAERFTLLSSFPAGVDPFFIVFHPDGSRAYVVNIVSSRVVVIRTADYTEAATIPLGGDSLQDAVISPDGSRLYVCNAALNQVEVIQTSDNSVLRPPIRTGHILPRSIGISPDGAYLFVGHRNPPGEMGTPVMMVRLSDNTVVSSVELPHNVRRLAVRAAGSRIFATEHDFDECYAIDVRDESLGIAASRNLNTVPDFLASPVGVATETFTIELAPEPLPEPFLRESLFLIDCGPCPECFERPCDPRLNVDLGHFLIWDPFKGIAESFSRSALNLKTEDGPLKAAAPLKGWGGEAVMFAASVPGADSKIADTGALLFFNGAGKLLGRVDGKIAGEQLGLDMDVYDDEVAVVSTERLIHFKSGKVTSAMPLEKSLLAQRGIHVAFTTDMDGDQRPEIILSAPFAAVGKYEGAGKIQVIGSKSRQVIRTFYGKASGRRLGELLQPL